MSELRYSLDSSALLAVLNGESGCEVVEAVLAISQIGTVNLAEVASKLNDYALSEDEVAQMIAATELIVIPFDRDQAVRVGALRSLTRSKGLSLGDRACLALAEKTATIALTADRAWLELDLGIRIELIR